MEEAPRTCFGATRVRCERAVTMRREEAACLRAAFAFGAARRASDRRGAVATAAVLVPVRALRGLAWILRPLAPPRTLPVEPGAARRGRAHSVSSTVAVGEATADAGFVGAAGGVAGPGCEPLAAGTVPADETDACRSQTWRSAPSGDCGLVK
ncbi:MAG: hypothetical protein NZ898_09740 [Myxococcota bacterium]|nr:hypothetical protein [Myxococcota bacterium]